MKPLIKILVIGLFLQACVPSLGLLDKGERKSLRQKNRCERKYSRYVSKCGAQVDTVLLPVVVGIDSLAIHKSFPVYKDTSSLDSLMEGYQRVIMDLGIDNDSIARILVARTRHVARQSIIRARCIKDTFRIDTSITIMIDNQQFSLRISAEITQPTPDSIIGKIIVPDQEFTGVLTHTETKIVPPEFTWKEQIYKSWKTISIWFIVILIVLLIVSFFRKAIKNFIR